MRSRWPDAGLVAAAAVASWRACGGARCSSARSRSRCSSPASPSSSPASTCRSASATTSTSRGSTRRCATPAGPPPPRSRPSTPRTSRPGDCGQEPAQHGAADASRRRPPAGWSPPTASRARTPTVPAPPDRGSPGLNSVITPTLRASRSRTAARSSTTSRSRSRRRTATTDPGIVVGSQLTLPTLRPVRALHRLQPARRREHPALRPEHAAARRARAHPPDRRHHLGHRALRGRSRSASPPQTSERLAAGDLAVRIPESGEDVFAIARALLQRHGGQPAEPDQPARDPVAAAAALRLRRVARAAHAAHDHPAGRRRDLRPARVLPTRDRAHGRAAAHPDRALRPPARPTSSRSAATTPGPSRSSRSRRTWCGWRRTCVDELRTLAEQNGSAAPAGRARRLLRRADGPAAHPPDRPQPHRQRDRARRGQAGDRHRRQQRDRGRARGARLRHRHEPAGRGPRVRPVLACRPLAQAHASAAPGSASPSRWRTRPCTPAGCRCGRCPARARASG